MTLARHTAIAVACLSLAACKAAEPTTPPPPPPAAGTLRWEFATPAGLPLAVQRDITGAPYLYVALKEGGLLVLRLNGTAPPTEVTRIPVSAFSGLHVTALTQQGTRLFLGLGDFFSNATRTGLAVVNVQTPQQPTVRAQWISPTVLSGTTALLADGDHVFLAAKRDGVFVFDVSAADTVRRIAAFLPDVNFPTANPSSTAHPNARGLALAGSRLYVANDAGGLRVLDVSNRAQPVEVGKYINSGIVNKPQAYNSVWIDNTRAYLAVDYCGLEIVDVSNPSAIQRIGWWNPWGCDGASNIWFNSGGHTNQLVFNATRRLALLSAGASELVAVDVSNPANPQLRAQFEATGTDQGAWGVGDSPDETYITYITAVLPFRGTWAGIRAIAPIE